jgi:hypothetical protein
MLRDSKQKIIWYILQRGHGGPEKIYEKRVFGTRRVGAVAVICLEY